MHPIHHRRIHEPYPARIWRPDTRSGLSTRLRHMALYWLPMVPGPPPRGAPGSLQRTERQTRPRGATAFSSSSPRTRCGAQQQPSKAAHQAIKDRPNQDQGIAAHSRSVHLRPHTNTIITPSEPDGVSSAPPFTAPRKEKKEKSEPHIKGQEELEVSSRGGGGLIPG